jgi:signal transduction histidine kinase
MTQNNNSPTVLIVDDTPSNLGMVVKIMEEKGYLVSIAQDGEEGLQRAQLVQPDLILLDVMMPGIDGFETCQRLKALESTRNIPVIFMTALASPEHKVKGFAAGGVDYVTKPLQIDEVMARVDAHIKLHVAQRQLEEKNAQLREYQEELEQKVAARTVELSDANRALEESRAQLRRLASRYQESGEEERKYLARELHEELAQILAGLQLNLSALSLRHATDSPKLREQLQQNMELTDQALIVTRNISTVLRPVALDMGIAASLEWLANRFSNQSGIQCEVDIEESAAKLGENYAIALFRIVQESLTNVAKHAKADHVDITFERSASHYILKIRDNGIGFDLGAKKTASLGLVGIQERALALGGVVSINSRPGSGTEILVRLPVPA